MTGNLKTLALALAMALPLTLLGAPTASATIVGGEFTSENGYPAHVAGADRVGTVHALTGATGVDCTETTYTGEITSASRSLDLTPIYKGCSTSSGAPATITHNGCVYRITVGTGTGGTPSDWHASADLVCTFGKQIEVHIYNSAAHTTPVCTLEIPPQSDLTGLTITDTTGSNDIKIEGTVGGIENSGTGACTGGPTFQLPDAELHVNLTISATSPKSIHVGVFFVP